MKQFKYLVLAASMSSVLVLFQNCQKFEATNSSEQSSEVARESQIFSFAIGKIPPVAPTIAPPVIDKVYGRDGVAAVYFTPAAQSSRLSGISFQVRNSCGGQTQAFVKSPARVTGLPLDTPCSFTIQLVATQGSSTFSNVSRAITMSSKKYFGYYNYYHGATGSEYNSTFDLSVQKTHGNLVYITQSEPRYLERIREAKEQGMFVVIDISIILYKRSTKPNYAGAGEFTDRRELLPDYKQRWEDFELKIEPYRDNIAAFYDEEVYWGAAYYAFPDRSQASIVAAFNQVNVAVAKVSNLIRETHPEIAYAMVDEGQAFAGRFFTDSVPNPQILETCVPCINAIQIPATVDWVGFEGQYPVTEQQYNNWAGVSIPDYLAATKAKMHPGQKLVLAPPTFLPVAETSEQIANMEMIVNRFWNLARSEPNLAAVIPYFWWEPKPRNQFGVEEDFKRFGLHLQVSPFLRNHFKKFGQCVVNKFAGDCVPTTTPVPPSTPSIGPGIFRVPPTSIYLSYGNYQYCAFTSEPHFLSYSPTTPASAYPAVATIPSNMQLLGPCPPVAAPRITFAGPYTWTAGSEITAVTPTNSGGPITSCVLSPSSAPLPASFGNLILDQSTCRISGIPTAAVAQGTYRLRASNAAGSSDADITITVMAPPPALIPAGIFRVPPSSIYLSDGSGYCGFDDEPHFLSYSNGNLASQYPSYTMIPLQMTPQGSCPRKGCTYSGGVEPGYPSCVWPSATAVHGGMADIRPISGGTGRFQATCSNAVWRVTYIDCVPTSSTPPPPTPPAPTPPPTTPPPTPPPTQPESFGEGPFGFGGNIFYSNGNFRFCRYRDLQHYLSQGYTMPWQTLPQLYPFNGYMINDGICGG